MKRSSLRAVWTLLFNGTAVLLLGHAGWGALRSRDFVPVSLFTIFTAAYSVGLLMQVSRYRLARATNVRLQAAGIYLFTAFTTELPVDDLMYMANASGQPYRGWGHAVLLISLLGSLVLAIACILALIKPRYGHIAAVFGAVLSWPYFAYVAWNLPWRDFVWLVTIHWDGELNVAAVLSLIVASAYSIASLVNRRAPATGIASPEVA